MRHRNEPIKRVLVKNLKKYRDKRGLTQEEAAERAEITAKYWQRLEMVSQIDLPSLPLLFKIAKTLGIKVADLLRD